MAETTQGNRSQNVTKQMKQKTFSLLVSGVITGNSSSSCEMIILRNNNHGGIIRVCMGIFTTAPRNKIIRQILTLLLQRIACYLTAYFDEKDEF